MREYVNNRVDKTLVAQAVSPELLEGLEENIRAAYEKFIDTVFAAKGGNKFIRGNWESFKQLQKDMARGAWEYAHGLPNQSIQEALSHPQNIHIWGAEGVREAYERFSDLLHRRANYSYSANHEKE